MFYLFLIYNLQYLIKYIIYISIPINLIYNIDLESMMEHYLDDNILFMDDSSSRDGIFKKPRLHGHDLASEQSSSKIGDKRPLTGGETESQQSPTFLRDDSSQISSRNPSDWGVDTNHPYSDYQAPKKVSGFSEYSRNIKLAKYSEDCNKMANLLEYHAKVYNRKFVHTFLDDNPIMGEQASQFFEGFTESHNIKPKSGTDCIENTTSLRNAFRNYR